MLIIIDYPNDMIHHKISIQTFNRLNVKLFHILDMPANTVCNHCRISQAEIFQEGGQFCLSCWQDRTLPDI
jgi:hypothetical protein